MNGVCVLSSWLDVCVMTCENGVLRMWVDCVYMLSSWLDEVFVIS